MQDYLQSLLDDIAVVLATRRKFRMITDIRQEDVLDSWRSMKNDQLSQTLADLGCFATDEQVRSYMKLPIHWGEYVSLS